MTDRVNYDDPYDLSVVLARDETPDSLAQLVLAAESSGTSHSDILRILTTRFALSFDDARLARDRVLGGRTRAAMPEPSNAPDPKRDPIAWASYQRVRGTPLSRIFAMQSTFASSSVSQTSTN